MEPSANDTRRTYAIGIVVLNGFSQLGFVWKPSSCFDTGSGTGDMRHLHGNRFGLGATKVALSLMLVQDAPGLLPAGS